MADERGTWTIKGDRTMSRGFVAQYAAEAALAVDGVASLDTSFVVSLKEAIGFEHAGRGVRVAFREERRDVVEITVFPVVWYGLVIPDVAWQIQEQVKNDVERYTGLEVDAVHVHVMGVMPPGEEDRA
jgi:uncharacterized alkaline shock family protein YloU